MPVSAEETAILKECFREYDKDGSGSISVKEFGEVYRQNNKDVSDEELAKIVAEVDCDGDGNIDLDEFMFMMTGGRSRNAHKAAPEVVVSPPAAEDGQATES